MTTPSVTHHSTQPVHSPQQAQHEHDHEHDHDEQHLQDQHHLDDQLNDHEQQLQQLQYNQLSQQLDNAVAVSEMSNQASEQSTQLTMDMSPSTPTPRPPTGSDEWHRQRRENHKEVERRRRETINEGISELSKVVPGCEKNKGSIVARAVQYIRQLRDAEATNVEKWTLEKLLADQACAELSGQLDQAKIEVESLRQELENLRRENQNIRGENALMRHQVEVSSLDSEQPAKKKSKLKADN